nr:hypothetical protein [Mycobacterium sp. E740]
MEPDSLEARELRDFRRATVSSFNALRDDMNDLRSELNDLRSELRGKLDAAAAGQQHIVELLEGLIADQG